jgi:hypothetical protein
MSDRRFRARSWASHCVSSASAFFIALALCLPGCGARAPDADPLFESPPLRAPAPALTDAALDAAIGGARAYLIRHTPQSGRFTYVIEPDGTENSDDYNVLRHGGTVYALGELHRRAPDPEVAAAIERAGRYLAGRYLAPGPIAGSEAIWSRPGEELSGDERRIKLGGLGLGLVALVALREVAPAAIALDRLRGLGALIGAMQRDDGSFHSKMKPDGSFDRRFRSLYYPGEAILGLVRLYRIDPDPRWLEIAGRGVRQLIDSRADIDPEDLPADHWLLIAIGELGGLLAERPAAAALGVDFATMRAGALRIADKMLAEQRAADAGGSFGRHRRSTPTATRLEGLLALLAALPASDPARPRLEAGARRGVTFLLGCQVTSSDRRGGGVVRRCPPARKRRDAEIRIDYVQHALSAFLGARRLLPDSR